jgi:hypothetical protein
MPKLEWTTVQRKVNDLLALEINPRKITEAKRQHLIKSLGKFNLADIPVINADNTIISGHQRIKALQILERGEELIDVRFPNRQLTEKELKEYMLIANTHAGEWDFDLFNDNFADIDMEMINIDIKTFEGFEDIEDEQTQIKRQAEVKELKPFSLTHILISFPPERLLDIQEFLEQIKNKDFVEYEQSSN